MGFVRRQREQRVSIAAAQGPAADGGGGVPGQPLTQPAGAVHDGCALALPEALSLRAHEVIK